MICYVNKQGLPQKKQQKKTFFKFYLMPQDKIGELEKLFIYFISINLKICIVQSLKLNELEKGKKMNNF